MGPLFATAARDLMEEIIIELEKALKTLDKPTPWSGELKVPDEFLDLIFERFFQRQNLPNLMPKTNYHILAAYIRAEEIDNEVVAVLDQIQRIAQQANPLT